MNIGISFAGVEYKGSNSIPCRVCRLTLNHPFVIYENDTNQKVYLCERHYKQWELRRSILMKKLSEQFREELNLWDKTNAITDKEVAAYHEFRGILEDAKSVYEGYPAELDAIEYIRQRLEASLR